MKKGFTLVEILVSLGIFIVIMTSSLGAMTGILTASNKARSLRTAMDTLNVSLETMSREIRFGTKYHCSVTSGTITDPRNCSTGANSISFLSSDNEQISYRYRNSGIERSINGSAYVPVTGSGIDITGLRFYVFGTTVGDTQQPNVVLVIRGHAGTTTGNKADFNLETYISQRKIDK